MDKVLEDALNHLVSPVIVGLVVLLATSRYHKRSDGQVRVECEFYPVVYLPRIKSELASRNYDIINLERSHRSNMRTHVNNLSSDLERLTKGLLTKESADQLRQYIKFARDELDVQFSASAASRPITGLPEDQWPKGVWVIRVLNSGKKPAKSLRLVVPNGMYEMVTKAGSGSVSKAIERLVELGEVYPNEPIDVLVWTDNADITRADDVTASFDHGVARTVIYEHAPRRWVVKLEWIRTHWMFSLSAAVLALLAIVVGTMTLGAHLAKTGS